MCDLQRDAGTAVPNQDMVGFGVDSISMVRRFEVRRTWYFAVDLNFL